MKRLKNNNSLEKWSQSLTYEEKIKKEKENKINIISRRNYEGDLISKRLKIIYIYQLIDVYNLK